MSEIIDTNEEFHEQMVAFWREKTVRSTRISTRFERAINSQVGEFNGDSILLALQDLFINGFGVVWSSVQLSIFQALVDSILPRIYMNEWEQVKGRVMAQRSMDRLYQETLVNMGRRNGKTWVVSGAAAALFLTVPGISIAVFSVGKRQAGMFMTSAVEKLELAFARGNGKGFKLIQKNQEMIIYEHPTGAKQILGCYPGSTKVSHFIASLPPPLFTLQRASLPYVVQNEMSSASLKRLNISRPLIVRSFHILPILMDSSRLEKGPMSSTSW